MLQKAKSNPSPESSQPFYDLGEAYRVRLKMSYTIQFFCERSRGNLGAIETERPLIQLWERSLFRLFREHRATFAH